MRVLKNINPSYPQAIVKLTPPTREELIKQSSFKYALIKEALNNSVPGVKKIIEQVPITGIYKNVLVDVKVKELKQGDYPCLPGYHLDCTMNPEHPTKPEIHHIYISGCNCRTKFIVSPVNIPYQDNRLIDVDYAIINQHTNIFEIEENVLYSYNRFNLHAPSVAQNDGLRLLIRVTETDLIKPIAIKL